MKRRIELTLEAEFPPDPLEMRAAVAEMEAQLSGEQFAVVEALALAILVRSNPWMAWTMAELAQRSDREAPPE